MLLDDLLKRHKDDLEKINRQRRVWLYASSVVFTGLIFLIFGWEWLSDQPRSIWWVIVSLMLIVSINWWYWTMKVVRIISYYQQIEYELINQIYHEIKEVRTELNDSFSSLFNRS